MLYLHEVWPGEIYPHVASIPLPGTLTVQFGIESYLIFTRSLTAAWCAPSRSSSPSARMGWHSSVWIAPSSLTLQGSICFSYSDKRLLSYLVDGCGMLIFMRKLQKSKPLQNSVNGNLSNAGEMLWADTSFRVQNRWLCLGDALRFIKTYFSNLDNPGEALHNLHWPEENILWNSGWQN